MKHWKKLVFTSLIFACITVALGPFFVPVVELDGLVSADEFIEADSKFIEINNVNVHYKEAGAG